jgi:hypothetical protein
LPQIRTTGRSIQRRPTPRRPHTLGWDYRAGTRGSVSRALDSLANVLFNRFQEYSGVFDLIGDFGFRYKVEVLVIAVKTDFKCVCNDF